MSEILPIRLLNLFRNSSLHSSLCKLILLSIIVNSSGFVLVYKGLEIIYKSLNQVELTFWGDGANYKPLFLSDKELLSSRFERINTREFKLDGKMYDFTCETRDNDTTCFICKLDINENILDEFLTNMVKEENHAKSRTVKILSNTQTISLITITAPFFKSTPQLHFCANATLFEENVLEGFSSIPKQPPTLLLS